jgi:hypothetical protein
MPRSRLTVRAPKGSGILRQIEQDPHHVDGVIVEIIETADGGKVEPRPGTVVHSAPTTAALATAGASVARAVAEAGEGAEPVVIVIERASHLSKAALRVALDAADGTSREVVLDVLHDG